MGIELQAEVILAFIAGLALLYLVGWLLLVPFKVLWKFLFNGIIGGIMLFVINMVGGIFGVTVSINLLTALIAGFLGVPGVVLLLVLQLILA